MPSVSDSICISMSHHASVRDSLSELSSASWASVFYVWFQSMRYVAIIKWTPQTNLNTPNWTELTINSTWEFFFLLLCKENGLKVFSVPILSLNRKVLTIYVRHFFLICWIMHPINLMVITTVVHQCLMVSYRNNWSKRKHVKMPWYQMINKDINKLSFKFTKEIDKKGHLKIQNLKASNYTAEKSFLSTSLIVALISKLKTKQHVNCIIVFLYVNIVYIIRTMVQHNHFFGDMKPMKIINTEIDNEGVFPLIPLFADFF